MNNITIQDQVKGYRGEVVFEIRDRKGRLVHIHKEQNIVKIFAKEMLSHCIMPTKIWDPDASTGAGAWVDSNIDPDNEFTPKYIIFGASYDDSTGQPLDTNDTRYYTADSTSGGYIPVKPSPGASDGGDLIHPIPISEPNRPLKRIEAVRFSASYQPADSPLVDSTVRAVNNVAIFETVLRLDEYNGFGASSSDFFTITEVGLVGGKLFDAVGACEATPEILFLEGSGGSYIAPLIASASGSATISLDTGVSGTDLDVIKEGDQVYITSTSGVGSTGAASGSGLDDLDQVQPYYLVTSKAVGGRDITLDRTPVDSSNTAIVGTIGVYRSSMRMFSHRILSVPVRKTENYEITVRWYVTFA